jgi:polar amino acid transport system substrate-binding protein
MNKRLSKHFVIPTQFTRILLAFCGVLGLFVSSTTFALQSPASNPASFSPEVHVVINNAPPYRIISKGKLTGIYIDIFEAMLKKLHWKARYSVVPFRRALKNMELGIADVMLGPNRTPHREEYMDFSLPAFPPEDRVFLVSDPKNIIHHYSDLKGKIIGTLRGSVYFKPFDTDPDLTKESGTSYSILLRMLEKERIDVLIMPSRLSKALISKSVVNIYTSPYRVKGQISYIAISRKSKLIRYIPELKQALAQIKKENIYAKVMKKYGEIEDFGDSAIPGQ